jgi:diguanylate cyclase (GGDEF)-like protein/PAS domain S-box-containing protein
MSKLTLHHDFNSPDWSVQLLQAVVEIQNAFIEESNIRRSFERMLAPLLSLTGSDYGFMGEVLYTPDQLPYMRAHALTDISWDAATKKLYDERMATGFEFHNLNTLFGVTLATGEIVVSNDPINDLRSGGLPKGHPGMTAYLGVPIKHNEKMVGMLGIANREGGYSEEIAHALSPLLITAGSMIDAMRATQKNKEIEAALQTQNKLLDAILNNIKDVLIITDHQCIIKELNRSTELIFGYEKNELVGNHINMIFSGQEKQLYGLKIKQYFLTGDSNLLFGRDEVHGLTKNNSEIVMELSINALRLGDQKLFVNSLQDITQRKKSELDLTKANKKLHEESETDEMSGLNNRRYFDKNLLKAFNASRHVSCDLGLVILDIDFFKLYNDNYGHQKGDRCIAIVGKLLSDFFVRSAEFPARIGGEEFAVVITHTQEKEIINSLVLFKKSLSDNHIIHEYSEFGVITISIGLAMRTKNAANVDELFGYADEALYEAKKNGRNQLVVYKNKN